MKDKECLRKAWKLIEHQAERSVDGVGLLPNRAHDTWSALATAASDFVIYRRLNDRITESGQALFGTDGLADIAKLPDRQLHDIFRHAMDVKKA